jgi:hypothetical protein
MSFVILFEKKYKVIVYKTKRMNAIVEIFNPNVSVTKINRSREKNNGLPL